MSTTNENNGDEFVTVVYDATFEAINKWAKAVKSWAAAALVYHLATIEVTSIVAENFTSAHLFKLDINKRMIKRAILEGIPEYYELIRVTNEFKGSRNQTSQQKDLMKQRRNALTKIDLIYNRLGNEVYGDEFATPIIISNPPTPSKSTPSVSVSQSTPKIKKKYVKKIVIDDDEDKAAVSPSQSTPSVSVSQDEDTAAVSDDFICDGVEDVYNSINQYFQSISSRLETLLNQKKEIIFTLASSGQEIILSLKSDDEDKLGEVVIDADEKMWYVVNGMAYEYDEYYSGNRRCLGEWDLENKVVRRRDFDAVEDVVEG